MSSAQRWLQVHGRKKWAHYYDPDSRARQVAFFDHFLKGSAPVPPWPRVEVEIRERYYEGRHHASTDWPLPEVAYQQFHLSARSGRLQRAPDPQHSSCSYDSLAEDAAALFDLRFEAATDIVGHIRLKLYVSCDASDDLDLFVALEKLDVAGQPVGFTHYGTFENGPVALGWLRVSHRALDLQRSTHYLPVLAHTREAKVSPGQIVETDIEIWPTGTHFDAGETLRLRIQGRDVFRVAKPLLYARHEDTVNRGAHRIWTGGATPSWLQLPVLGPKQA